VLPETGGRLEIAELELEPPRAGEALVRLYASGVCHSDLNAIDGTATTPCPAVLGHEGAGIVEAVGPGVRSVRPGQHVALSWAPSCGACEECLRDLHHLCSEAWPAMGTGGLMDSTTRLSRDGEPVYHYSFLSTFAERAVVPERSLLNPRPPGAVAAGNVETSQAVVDALFGCLGVLAASQGTMNNVTFGNARHQYYETICGGAGAGIANW